jgi:hypothetical protein
MHGFSIGLRHSNYNNKVERHPVHCIFISLSTNNDLSHKKAFGSQKEQGTRF